MARKGLMEQDLKTLDVTKLNPLSPEVISRQATINIGTIGHVAHGKSTVVKAISGVQTVRFKNELERNITIKLGYANAKIYKCEDDACPRPMCYKAYGSSKEDSPLCDVPGFEKARMKLMRHVSFVDCPGHDILMATMLNGAAIMDGALLLIAGNESCPQPQTSEHLAAVEIMRLKHIIILQNKIDLIQESVALNQHDAIQKFIQGTIADGAPVIPISAQLKYNVDVVCEMIIKRIPIPSAPIPAHRTPPHSTALYHTPPHSIAGHHCGRRAGDPHQRAAQVQRGRGVRDDNQAHSHPLCPYPRTLHPTALHHAAPHSTSLHRTTPQGTIADGAPVIPISAQLKYNVDVVCEMIIKRIPIPDRDFVSPPNMIVIRSFDVNKPGAEVDDIKGGVAGGSILHGVLRVGQKIEVRPGIVAKDADGNIRCTPIFSRIISLFAEQNELQFAVPGGLIGVGTTIDPTLTRADRLVGQVLGEVGALPDVFVELEINFFLLRRLLGVRTKGTEKQGKVAKLTKGEVLMLNIGSMSTGARVVAVKNDLAKLHLTSPVCTKTGEKLALSRRVEKHWRLIGWGQIQAGVKLDVPPPVDLPK
ncbi:unnamed protein product [Closterium sp. Naga37s-1]|nr:unnamed protein product [Closterium sp. Naga37s-1]